MSIKAYVRNNKHLYKGIRLLRAFQYNVLRKSVFETNANLRRLGLRQSPLKALYGKYQGERCFIIATGPSLTMDDLGTLRYEFTFGMNSLAQAFEELGWGPTFYGIQDHRVYWSVAEKLRTMPETQLLLGGNLKWHAKLPQKAIVFPLDLLNHEMHPDDNYNTKFSEDCSERVFDGYSITYSLIQLAVYFGFSEIYLLGCDCGYSGGGKHFIEHDVLDPYYSSAQQRMFFSYGIAKEFAEKHNVRIFNATRGGELEIFQRVSFDGITKRGIFS